MNEIKRGRGRPTIYKDRIDRKVFFDSADYAVIQKAAEKLGISTVKFINIAAMQMATNKPAVWETPAVTVTTTKMGSTRR